MLRQLLPLWSLEEPARILATAARRIEIFRNRHAGQTCIVVGNGPSLNRTDLALVGQYPSFAVNGIFYKTEETGYRPTYYVVEDKHVIRDNLERIRTFQPQPGGARFFPSRYRAALGGPDTYFLNLNRGFYEPRSDYYHIPRFSPNAARRVYCGHSVTILNIQLAYFMGFARVLLVGMDFSYTIPDTAIVTRNVLESTEDDINHFHPEYFGKGKRWHDPRLDKVLRAYRLCKLIFDLEGRAILNATVGGKLDVFDRVLLEDALD
jgi:hypothetical protein